MDNFEVKHMAVDLYHLNDSGDRSVESSTEYFTLNYEDIVIDLNKPIEIKELTVTQGELEIPMEHEAQVSYLKYLIKTNREDKNNATKDRDT